jgi:hypothetical protein
MEKQCKSALFGDGKFSLFPPWASSDWVDTIWAEPDPYPLAGVQSIQKLDATVTILINPG